ncbi:MAG: 4Fe-4S dicluster domain-containing protein [Planctomycetota bacterium]
MNELLEPVFALARPLANPISALLIALCLSRARRVRPPARAAGLVALVVLALCAAYHAAALHPRAAQWLEATNTPLATVFLVVIIPALYLPRNWRYKLFLLLPAGFLIAMILDIFNNYRAMPAGAGGFSWFPVRPVWLMAGAASFLVLIEPFLSLTWLRRSVRISCALVLLYGGFALRKDYRDYQAMLSRRPLARLDVMSLSETSPVLQSPTRMLHLPSAPCRFSADGGYVQGCNMELFQRVTQIDFNKVAARDPAELGTFEVALGALTLFLILCFLTARWCCGWLCPLSALGDLVDWVRRLAGAPHVKPSQPVKLAYLFSGMSLATVGILLAKAVPSLDQDGRFAGCKIPIYPFCKLCPGNQICPVAAEGPGAYPGLPTWEWGFGLFRIGVVAVLVLFVASFAAGRRLWCRFCPMGMISGIFNRGGFLALCKNSQKCNGCGVCAEVCPMDIDTVRSEREHRDVSSYDCILCLKCVASCPRDGCLSLELGGVKVTESRFAP